MWFIKLVGCTCQRMFARSKVLGMEGKINNENRVSERCFNF